MMYRAKVTFIQKWVGDNFNCNFVRDEFDVFAEVLNEDLAACLENLNNLEYRRRLLLSEINIKYHAPSKLP